MRLRTSVVLAALILSGCQQMVWVKEGATEEQFQKDMAEARLDAVKYGYVAPGTGGNGFVSGYEEATRRNEIVNASMTAKGYRLIPRSDAEKMGLQLTPAH